MFLEKMKKKKTHTEVRREKTKDRTRETRSRHNMLRKNYDNKGLVYLRQLFSQRKILSALFVTDVLWKVTYFVFRNKTQRIVK